MSILQLTKRVYKSCYHSFQEISIKKHYKTNKRLNFHMASWTRWIDVIIIFIGLASGRFAKIGHVFNEKNFGVVRFRRNNRRC